MKKIVLMLMMFYIQFSNAQVYDPVKWTASVVKISDSEYELIAKANIEKGWHLYSQNVPAEGPKATIFSFAGRAEYLKKGNTKEEQGIVVEDPVYEMKIKYFINKAIFKQRIKVKNKTAFEIRGNVQFMVCNDTKCLPPKQAELLFKVK